MRCANCRLDGAAPFDHYRAMPDGFTFRKMWTCTPASDVQAVRA